MKKKIQVVTIPANNYETPPHLLKEILEEFGLTKHADEFIDIAATKQNRKFERYVTKKQDAFKQNFKDNFLFCNPEFDNLFSWVSFCHDLATDCNCTSLMLLPTYCDSIWWQNYIGDKMQYCDDFKFLNKRLGFWYRNRPVDEFYKKLGIKPNRYWMPCVWILWRGRY